MCRFASGEELGEVERRVAVGETEEDGEGVAEHLAQHPTGQVPGIAGPEALAVVALDAWGGHRLAAPAEAAQAVAAHRVGGVLPLPIGRTAGNPGRSQLLTQQRMPVIAVPSHLPGRALHQLRGQFPIGGVGRSARQRGHHPRPTGAQMGANPRENRRAALIVAGGGLPAEAGTAASAAAATDRDGHTIDEGEGRIMRQAVAHPRPHVLLDYPQIGRLSRTGGAMDPRYHRNPARMVAPERVGDGHILVIAQELSHHVHRQHLAIGQSGARPAGAQAAPIRIALHLVQQLIDQAIDGYRERFQVPGTPP